MYSVTVIPIARGSAVAELSYFSALAYPEGSLITVPVRGRQRTAVVTGCESVRNVKAQLRSKDFALRKLERQKAQVLLSPEFIRAIERTARYHAATVGAVLFSYLPKALLSLETLPLPQDSDRPRLRGFIVPRVYQGLASSRMEFYRSSVREAFAAGGSVFIVVPSIADGERVYEELSGGIKEHAYLLHGSQKKTQQVAALKELLASKHPVLVIAPSSFLSIPRHDLATIIVEREGSSLYRSRTRPFVDARILAHELAQALGGQLFLADLPLRIESVYRREQGEYEEVVTGAHRMHFPTKARIVNMQGVATSLKTSFRVLSHELLERMHESGEHGGRTVLYNARRGLSPITLCRDCGTVVTCNECDASVVLHKGAEENYFLCHSCGALRHAREVCKNCRSWRLEAFGIGTERIEDELANALPGRDVHVLSSDTAKSHTAARKIVDAFYTTPGSVLIGTEMALPYLSKHVPLVGVVSLDALLSLASWNIYERIAATVTRLREVAGEELILQTRRPEADILQTLLGGNFSRFYRCELAARKNLGYPPYTVIIKVAVTGAQDGLEEKMEHAAELLKPYDLVTFSRLLRAPGGKYMLPGFIRVTRDEWPDDELLARLAQLPPAYSVTMDPDSIL